MKGIIVFFLFLGLILGIPKGFPHDAKYSKTLFVDQEQFGKKLKDLSSDEKGSFLVLINILKKSSLGRRLWQKAEEKAMNEGKALLEVLGLGKGSYTDTALIRRFSLSDPLQVKVELRSKISINGELSLLDGVLDLAHELTHYIFRRPFDPYARDFSMESFIRGTIEGEGGEVDAYMNECQVLVELFPAKIHRNYHCHRILDASGEVFSRRMALEHFYRVGNYFQEFLSILSKNGLEGRFPMLSNDSPAFISSAYSVPYPIAAYAEFKMVRERACANDESRLRMMKDNLDQSHQQYHPGSLDFAKYKLAMQRLEESFFSRCESN